MPSPQQSTRVGQLRAQGLRVTSSRLAVLEAIDVLHGHPNAEEILLTARDRLGSISTQSVYDTLHTLTGVGLLRRIEPAGSPARYELRVGDNHHHLVCTSCGATRDVDCAVGETPCLEPSSTDGFEIAEAEVIFWGRCPDCKNTPSTKGATYDRPQ